MTWTTVAVADGTTLDAWIEHPEPTFTRAPAVIVLQELAGVNAYIRDVARRVADLGYVAIAPDLFHRTARRFEGDYDDPAAGLAHARALTPAGVAADLEATRARLAADPCCEGARVAAWGFCMGARVAHRANIVLPLRAAVAFYGSWPTEPDDVARLRAPTLLAWGGSDPHVAPAARRAFIDALAAAGKPYIDVVFGEASHGFCCDRHPASYHAPSAHVAWALATAFLAEHLPVDTKA
ncbi:MAG TPA: dienelactone hydrolase family protein [Kofleriaceae bacterium]|nr:dienelactone hydrolase family protein [Kofleriaceae bacterium]